MSNLGKMCECGGRTLLDGEALCPSCRRSHQSLARRLQGAGQEGAALVGKAVVQVKAGAQAAERLAVPLAHTGVELAKARAVPMVREAFKQAEAGGDRVIRAAVPLAERLLKRVKTYLEKKQRSAE